MSSSSILERCLSLLEILAEAPEGMALGQIAERAGLPKSATHRMLNALVDGGFAAQLPSRDYRLTMRFVTLGFRFIGRTGILEQCQRVLDDLAQETGELVRMTLVEGRGLVWIAKAQGANGPLKLDPVMGRDVVPFATATGKVWLASLGVNEAVDIALEAGLGGNGRHGLNVITAADRLIEELKVTRERGYGLAWEEADPGICAVAVAIPSPADGDQVIGTLSVAGPTFRLSQQDLEGCLPRLRDAAGVIRGLSALVRYSSAQGLISTVPAARTG